VTLRALSIVVVLTAAARAQTPPLAQIKDDKQLADALSQITQDPSVPVSDDKARPLAQALMTEGVKRLQAKEYDQALANFLEAYGKFPSPKILLNVASTLRDMGRLADAANTYHRYLLDPATGSDRVAEVKELLLKLDEQLTILTVRVFPRGSEISIDGGPFIAVGSSLLTRVRPGLHMIRIRHAEQSNEVTVNGFEGENKEVAPTINVAEPMAPPIEKDVGDIPQTAWLAVGTQYGTENAASNSRSVRAGYQGPVINPVVPTYETSATGDAIVHYPGAPSTISSGVLGILRIDGKGRGFAGGAGIAIANPHFEGELAVLRSDEWGGYLGMRYRPLTGWFRPYGAVGMPLFVFDADKLDDMGNVIGTSKHVSVGIRYAAGIELELNGHLSVQADLGGEYFFLIKGFQHDNKTYESSVFVPTVGVIGRL
jgi:hypothetical protein